MRRRLAAVLLFLSSGVGSIPLLMPAPASEEPARWEAPRFQYNTRTKEIELSKEGRIQPWIRQRGSTIHADRIFWNETTRIGRCQDNVRIVDTTNEMVITGGAATHNARTEQSVVTINPVLVLTRRQARVTARELHRNMRDQTAEAIGDVLVVTTNGNARGERAVYNQRTKVITLSGHPILERDGDIHRALEIVLFQEDKRVEMRGEARLASGADFIKADRIVLFDREPDKKNGDPPQPTTNDKPRKNREAFFYGNVRAFSYNKQGELESVSAGDYGEFYNLTDYSRLTGNARMVMARDNTLVRSMVMERYGLERLAVARGGVFLVRAFRTVSGQLARYYMDEKKVYLTGNPVVREYDDAYRADVVVFDSERDAVSWTGSSMGVIGIVDQTRKALDWGKSQGGLAGASRGGYLASEVLGEVFVSASGKPVTNQGRLRYGVPLASWDETGAPAHLVTRDLFSAARLDRTDGSRLLFDYNTHMQFGTAGVSVPPFRGVAVSALTNQADGPAVRPEMRTNPVAVPTNRPASPGTVTNRPAATNQRPAAGTGETILLHEGRLAVVPGTDAPLLEAGPLVFGRPRSPLLVTVRPTRLQLAVLTNLRGITNWQAAPAVVLLRFTALQGLRITNESGAEAATREVRPLLERECPPGRILNLDLVRFQRLDQRLTEAVSNLTASVAATNAKPAPGPGAKNPKDAPAVVPAVPTGVAWSGPARERILGLLREAGGLWSTENFPVRPTEFGDGLTALIRLIRSAPARAPATRASLAGGSRL